MPESVEKRIKIGKVQKAILAGLATGVMISVAIMAPNALKLFKPILKKNKAGKYNFWRSLENLERGGLVEKNEKGQYSVTDKGRNALLIHSTDILRKPMRWDKRWRVIIFDIPKDREKIRQRLRHTILIHGFLMLQKSVWIYPYQCEDLVALLKSELRLGRQLLYMVVEGLENDKHIRDHFKL